MDTILLLIQVLLVACGALGGLVAWFHRLTARRFDGLNSKINRFGENLREHEHECGLRNERQERELGRLAGLIEGGKEK